MPDGVRLGGAFYEVTADTAPLVRAMAQAEAQSKKSAQAIAAATGLTEREATRHIQNLIRQEQQLQKTTQATASNFNDLAKGVGILATAAAAGAATLATLHQAMTKIADSTQKAAQAQFALNALYGEAAPIITKFAEAQASAIGRSRTDAKEAAASVATLARNYALTGDQIQKVLTISANLAAVRGIDLSAAAERTQSALRGEAEAIEYLGIALQSNALKALANMTAEERKHFETLSDITKAQIILNALQDQSNDLQGQAAKRAQDAAGAYDTLKARSDDLATSIGQRLSPAVVGATNVLAGWVKSADDFVQSDFVSNLADAAAIMGAIATLSPQAIADALQRVGAHQQEQAHPTFGPSPAEIAQANQDVEAAQKQQAAKDKDRRKAELDAADKANKATAESAIKAIDQERKAKEQWYDEEKQRIEARRTYQLEDIETRKDAAIKALEEEKRVAKEALETQIEEQERLKKARLDAAEAAAEQARQAIDAEKQRLEIAREAEDRERDDARQQADRARDRAREDEDRTLEDARRTEDRDREQSQRETIRALEEERDARIQAIDDIIEADKRQADQALRNIERQADRARAASDKALARLEQRGEKEDERHRKRMQALDDEQGAAEKAHQATLDALKDEEESRLGILDAQLKALDAQEKSADAAERVAGIQKRIADAQKAATAARGTGTPAEIAAARGDLTTALRVGNEVSIANARERLVKLAGQGDAAIQKADEDLADAQKDLAKESVDTARDAERDKLKAAQDAIKAETATREQALRQELDVIKTGIDARKRAEDDEDRRRKQSLEREQENERAKLKATLDRLDKRKQAAQDTTQDEAKALRETLDAEKKASDERIRIARERFDTDTQTLQDRRREEDRYRSDERKAQDQALQDEREAQDRFRQDERAEQDKALAVQLAAVASTLQLERDETEAHFNGPNGTITQLKKAIEDSELLYSRRLAAAQASFEAERKAAELQYTNPEGNGQLQLLEKQRQAEIQALADRKTEYEDQAKAFHDMIAAMIDDLNKLGAAASNQGIPRIGGAPGSAGADSRAAGSGKATSASSSSTPSSSSGRQVQGTWGTWLNDALDVAGVSDDWLTGLEQLAQRENAGHDPDLDNREGSGATGLLQVKPGTFQGYRDKSLPDNIHDPVANLVAGINWIKAKYKHVNNIPGLYEGPPKFKGYDAGGMIREPVIGRGLRSGQPYAFAERGPEYLIGRRQTASMLGPGPRTDYAGMGAFMSTVHPGGSGSSVVEGDVIFNGVTYEQAEMRQRQRQHRQSLLRGAGRLRHA